jgi:hypothetical protein
LKNGNAFFSEGKTIPALNIKKRLSDAAFAVRQVSGKKNIYAKNTH